MVGFSVMQIRLLCTRDRPCRTGQIHLPVFCSAGVRVVGTGPPPELSVLSKWIPSFKESLVNQEYQQIDQLIAYSRPE